MIAADSPLTVEPSFAVRMIRAEFEEMPGLRLTLAQAARLWSMPEYACEHALDHLVVAGFLMRDTTSRYTRRGAAR